MENTLEIQAFVERVFARLPAALPGAFAFWHWPHAGRPTEEAVAVLPVPGLDPERLIQAVMDVGHYVGNVEHVAVSRVIADARYVMPAKVRFYQKIDLPILGSVQHDLVLQRLPAKGGWDMAAWDLNKAETDALNSKEGFRSDYSHGLWLAKPGMLGYALGSAPKREDVGFLKYKALTAGADAAASRVLKSNLDGMARWAARR